MRIKLLPVLVSLCMLPSLTYAVEVAVASDTRDTQKKVSGDSTKKVTDAGVKTLATQTTTPPSASLVMPNMPTARFGSWRFGVWRNNHGGRYHHGIDFSGHAGSPSDDVYYSDNGTLRNNGALANNKVDFIRKNVPDQVVMLHARSVVAGKGGSPVIAGKKALVMGSTDGAGNKERCTYKGQKNCSGYAKHLHYEYHLRRDSNRQRYLGVGGKIGFTTKSGGKGVTFHKDSINLKNKMSIEGYVVTDPTPYLPRDYLYTDSTDPDPRMWDYLGNTGRTQYNALYRPSPPLSPLAAGARKPTKMFVNLPVFNDKLTPEDIAAMAAGAVDMSLYADGAGYDLSGQLMSQQMAASFLSASDGNDWSSLPQPPPADLSEKTPQEIVNLLAFQRFGNVEWEKQMVNLSSKGLLTEYALMNAEENFLRQQNQRMKNRIELQLASLNQAQLFEYNKKIEAMNVIATAEAVPRIIDRDLEQLPNGFYQNTTGNSAQPQFDASNLPSDLDGLLEALMDAIRQGEGPSYDAWNNGTACGKAGRANPNGGGKWKPTTMTPVQIIRTYRTNYRVGQSVSKGADNTCDNFIFASGFIQTVPWTLAGLIKKYPQYANVPYVPENQRFMAKNGLLLNSTRSALANFLRHGGNDDAYIEAMWELSREWASIGTPVGKRKAVGTARYPNETYHNKGKGNKAHAETTTAVYAIMKRIQQFHANQ